MFIYLSLTAIFLSFFIILKQHLPLHILTDNLLYIYVLSKLTQNFERKIIDGKIDQTASWFKNNYVIH
jgi:hypothetical protein